MRAAVIQMTSVKDVDQNLDQANTLLSSAHDQGAEIAVLPEMFACLGVKNQFQLAKTRFVANDVIARLGEWAKQYRMYVVAGSMPMLPEQRVDEKVLAASLVFSPQGKLISQYNKIHLFDVEVGDEKGSYRESDTFVAGTEIKTVDIEGRKLGLSVCYDLRFPELYQKYQHLGCDLITVPSAFTYETGRKHWEILLRARAIETQSFVLAADQVGVHEDGRRTWGQSMIVAPDGEVLTQAGNTDTGVFVADLDFNLLKEIRRKMPITHHKKLGHL